MREYNPKEGKEIAFEKEDFKILFKVIIYNAEVSTKFKLFYYDTNQDELKEIIVCKYSELTSVKFLNSLRELYIKLKDDEITMIRKKITKYYESNNIFEIEQDEKYMSFKEMHTKMRYYIESSPNAIHVKITEEWFAIANNMIQSMIEALKIPYSQIEVVRLLKENNALKYNRHSNYYNIGNKKYLCLHKLKFKNEQDGDINNYEV